MNQTQRLICSCMLAWSTLSSPVWAQTASDAATEPNNDPFVQQRNAIAEANRVYKEKVAVAQKEFDRKEDAASKILDRKVAEARAERNKAVAAAKAAGG